MSDIRARPGEAIPDYPYTMHIALDGSGINGLEGMAGVSSVALIYKPYKLVSREFHPEDTVIRVLDASVGDGSLTVMAGPCSVESREQLMETADFVAAHGATILRGGRLLQRDIHAGMEIERGCHHPSKRVSVSSRVNQ